MATKNHGPQIKNDKAYEELRKQGNSKEKSARIANSNLHETGKKGGQSEKYEDRTKEELIQKAREIGLKGYSRLSKQALIDTLRNH